MVAKRQPWLLFGGAAIVFSLIFFRLSWEQSTYQQGGVRVQGVVTEKVHTQGYSSPGRATSGSFGDYFVLYRFVTLDGRTHDGKDDVLPKLWNELHVGDPVAVEYLAESPDTNQIPEQHAEANTFRIVGLVCLLLGLAFLGRGFRLASK